MDQQFVNALPVLKILLDNDYNAYFVGGAIRDYLLGRPIHDIDIATSATPQQVMSLFPKYVPIGVEHGTVLVMYGEHEYEVTTFRTEKEYNDFRHPVSVSYIDSIADDLSRRDFTMNAIAMDIDGKLVDPFDGYGDLQKKIIQTVGLASERFSEDPLRMMRALRFMSQLSFALDPKTEQAIAENKQLMSHIAVERIKVEFEKLLHGPSVKRALQLMISTDFYQYLPAFSNKQDELEVFSTLSLSQLNSELELWAVLIKKLQISKIESFFRLWKCPKTLINDVSTIIDAISYIEKNGWDRKVVYILGKRLSFCTANVFSVLFQKNSIEEKKTVHKLLLTLPIESRKDLQVNGNELIKWVGKPPGPWLTTLINEIEDAVLNKKVKNANEEIKRWVQQCRLTRESNY